MARLVHSKWPAPSLFHCKSFHLVQPVRGITLSLHPKNLDQAHFAVQITAVGLLAVRFALHTVPNPQFNDSPKTSPQPYINYTACARPWISVKNHRNAVARIQILVRALPTSNRASPKTPCERANRVDMPHGRSNRQGRVLISEWCVQEARAITPPMKHIPSALLPFDHNLRASSVLSTLHKSKAVRELFCQEGQCVTALANAAFRQNTRWVPRSLATLPTATWLPCAKVKEERSKQPARSLESAETGGKVVNHNTVAKLSKCVPTLEHRRDRDPFRE